MSTLSLFSEAIAAASSIRERNQLEPKVAVILGSGLGAFAQTLTDATIVPYSEITYFPVSTVEGHEGRLYLGKIGETPVLVMQGRVHLYEGYSPAEVAFPIRVLRQMGIEKIILTNAAGGICPDFTPGELVLIADHINLTGHNPLLGHNEPRFGPRFFDMTDAYSPRLRELAQTVAAKQNYKLKEGVYVGILGPNFETPAEIRAFGRMGGDMVGMSTIQEAIAARHMGLELMGISCITNLAAGLHKEKLTHEDVLLTGARAEQQMVSLLKALIPQMAALPKMNEAGAQE